MKKKPPEHENHERWLVSYADFITLLFAFFVVMFASSQTDKSKAKAMSEAVTAALENGKTVGVPPIVAKILGGTVDDKGQGNAQMKGPGGAQRAAKEAPPDEILELLPSLQRLTSQLEMELKDGKLEIHMEPRGMVVSLREATFFPSGDDELAAKSMGVIAKLAGVVKDLPNEISIEGHTDSVPIHTVRFPSNWELSSARSIAMLKIFQSKFAIDAKRLSVVGYADTKPIMDNDTLEARARNRRVDVVIKNITGLRAVDKKAKAAAAAVNAEKPSPVPHK